MPARMECRVVARAETSFWRSANAGEARNGCGLCHVTEMERKKVPTVTVLSYSAAGLGLRHRSSACSVATS